QVDLFKERLSFIPYVCNSIPCFFHLVKYSIFKLLEFLGYNIIDSICYRSEKCIYFFPVIIYKLSYDSDRSCDDSEDRCSPLFKEVGYSVPDGDGYILDSFPYLCEEVFDAVPYIAGRFSYSIPNLSKFLLDFIPIIVYIDSGSD